MGIGLAPNWLRRVSPPLLHMTTLSTVNNTDETNYVICFVNYQLRRQDGTGPDDHAHAVTHSICQLIIPDGPVIIKQIYTVSWILNKDGRVGVILCWLVLGHYSTQCGLR